MDIAQILERIFGHLARLGRPIAHRRRAGVSAESIAQRFVAVGMPCPSDVALVYSIADGTNTNSSDLIGDISFFPGYYWLSLEEAFETYRAIRLRPDWRPDWLPLFASGGGDFYAAVCSNREGAFGGMLGFLAGEPEQFIEFPTLGALLETIAECYLREAFYLSEAGLEADYRLMREISSEVSPAFQDIAVPIGGA